MKYSHEIDSIFEREVKQQDILEAVGKGKSPHAVQFDSAHEDLVSSLRLLGQHGESIFCGSQEAVCDLDVRILRVPDQC